MSADPNQPPPTPPPMPATPPAVTTDPPLQFDRAEFAGETALTCASCKTPITDEYYQINGQTICAKCRTQLGAFLAGGSKGSRFLRAAGAGIGAGFVGFLIYYFISVIFHGQYGIVGFAVAWMVGNAVRWGSDRVGGREYQILAGILTYVSICSVYMPAVLTVKRNWITAFIISMEAPWLDGFDNFIGWIIIGFSVFYAWQINRKLNFNVSGPFFARQSTPPAAP